MNDLMAQITDLAEQSKGWILLAGLVFLRVGAMMALLPGFGEQMIPARIRLALGLAFTAVVFPAVSEKITVGLTLWTGLIEVLVGLMLGAGLRLMVHALQIAATIVAQSISLSQLIGGIANEPSPALGTLLTIAGITLAMVLGLHVQAAALIVQSYGLWPAGSMPFSGDVSAWGVGQVANAFALAFTLSAPFMIATLIYNLATGVINRAMPQLMVAMIGAPALTLGGMALLAIAAPMMVSIWSDAFQNFLRNPTGGGG